MKRAILILLLSSVNLRAEYKVFGDEYFYLSVQIYSDDAESISLNVLLKEQTSLCIDTTSCSTIIDSLLCSTIYSPWSPNVYYRIYKDLFKESNCFTENPTLFMSDFMHTFDQVAKTASFNTEEGNYVRIKYVKICGLFVNIYCDKYEYFNSNLSKDDIYRHKNYICLPISVFQFYEDANLKIEFVKY